jgi:hypothetical protein
MPRVTLGINSLVDFLAFYYDFRIFFIDISYVLNLNYPTSSNAFVVLYSVQQVVFVHLFPLRFELMIFAFQHENIWLIDNNYIYDEIHMSQDNHHLLDK